MCVCGRLGPALTSSVIWSSRFHWMCVVSRLCVRNVQNVNGLFSQRPDCRSLGRERTSERGGELSKRYRHQRINERTNGRTGQLPNENILVSCTHSVSFRTRIIRRIGILYCDSGSEHRAQRCCSMFSVFRRKQYSAVRRLNVVRLK